MNNPRNFGSNLRFLKQGRRLSLTEFSEILQIPRSTLQAVLEDGNTSLDTACRIADALQIPLSALTDGQLLPESADVLQGILLSIDWYSNLSPEKQKTASTGFALLLEVLQR